MAQPVSDTIVQSDTLRRLAAVLGLKTQSAEFAQVWDLMRQEDWTEGDVSANMARARRDAAAKLQINRRYGLAQPARGVRSANRGAPSPWSAQAGAIAARMTHLARLDPDVVRFRRRVLRGRLLSAAEVRRWLQTNRTHQLMRIAEALVRTFWWEINDAVVFVLTDAAPARSPVRATTTIVIGVEAGPRISVEAEAWVPAYVVADLYRRIQARLRPRGRGRTRPVTPQAAALVRFLEDPANEHRSWRQRLVAWNDANPSFSFRDRANFRRAFCKARERLSDKAAVIHQ